MCKDIRYILSILFIIASTLSAAAQDDANTLIQTGIVLSNNGNYDEAINYFDNAIVYDSYNADAWYYKGDAYLKKGDYSQAIISWEKAKSLGYSISWLNQAEAFRQQGSYAASVEFYLKATQTESKDLQAWTGLAYAYEALGKEDEAINSYKSGLSIASNDGELTLNLANLLFKKGSFDQAINYYKKADNLGGSIPWASLANELYLNGNYQYALEFFKKATETDKEDAESWRDMGSTYYQLGDRDNAIKCYLNALKIKPTDSETLIMLGRIYDEIKNYYLAIDCYERAKDLGKDINWPDLARNHYDAKEYVASIEYYKKAIKYKNNDIELWKQIGYAYFYVDSFENACDSFRNAINISSDSQSYLWLGKCLYELGRCSEAIASYNDAINIGGEFVGEAKNAMAEAVKCEIDRLCNLGWEMIKNGKNEDAIVQFTNALDLDPESQTARDGLNNAKRNILIRTLGITLITIIILAVIILAVRKRRRSAVRDTLDFGTAASSMHYEDDQFPDSNEVYDLAQDQAEDDSLNDNNRIPEHAECPYCKSLIKETMDQLGGVVRCTCGTLQHKQCLQVNSNRCLVCGRTMGNT